MEMECFIAIFFLFTGINTLQASLVQMRIVKETANYGYFGSNTADTDSTNQLVASVKPANFTGPVLMRRLIGKCYNLTLDRYRYTFCPFQNLTQYEISPRWNAYQGILGIWSHWEIRNNTFSAMVHKKGDKCGDIDRSIKVTVECGQRENLLNVSEPSRCEYAALFSTRYACHPDALLVYPRLGGGLRAEWDRLYTELRAGDITEKGYEVGLQKIFHKAGLAENESPSAAETTTVTTAENAPFGNISVCNKEYKSLQNEIAKLNHELEALKLLLDLNMIQNRTNKPQRITSYQ